jgi:hypothetical protein
MVLLILPLILLCALLVLILKQCAHTNSQSMQKHTHPETDGWKDKMEVMIYVTFNLTAVVKYVVK